MRTSAQVSRFQRAVVVGAALAGVLWGASGIVAFLDPGPDPGPPGSSSFYLIEGSHALAETGIFVALIGLWRSQTTLIGRLGNVVFGLAVTATLLLAVLTFLVVGGTALGLAPSMPVAGQTVPAPLVALATAVFSFTLVGVLAGYIGSGVTTIRAGMWPPLSGWFLIVFPFLIAANLNFYPVGIVVGVLWLALAWVARKRPLARIGPILCAGSGQRGQGSQQGR